ncbi:hypothetical protein JTE90_011378 [Oedothorax gibbosus]|uniref:Uncharacterized protein n=1 Tax=Oedothorax gibbosus TaxID=931172 RepID=A0AAV6VKX1_9ARAC|nr:hypothetical protein JTE90_011378 [Oedothorax gibbosus]
MAVVVCGQRVSGWLSCEADESGSNWHLQLGAFARTRDYTSSTQWQQERFCRMAPSADRTTLCSQNLVTFSFEK